MKKLLIITCLTCVLAIAAQAAEGEKEKKPSASAEKKALRKELVEKYDTNKNGRLDKEEKSKMTPEDAEKWKSLAPAPKKKEAEGEPK